MVPDATVVEIDRKRDRVLWWTFAGLNANFELAAAWNGTPRFDNFSIALDGCVALERVREWIRDATPIDPIHFDRLHRPKFHECLPAKVLTDIIRARVHDAVCVGIARDSQILYRDLG